MSVYSKSFDRSLPTVVQAMSRRYATISTTLVEAINLRTSTTIRWTPTMHLRVEAATKLRTL